MSRDPDDLQIETGVREAQKARDTAASRSSVARRALLANFAEGVAGFVLLFYLDHPDTRSIPIEDVMHWVRLGEAIGMGRETIFEMIRAAEAQLNERDLHDSRGQRRAVRTSVCYPPPRGTSGGPR